MYSVVCKARGDTTPHRVYVCQSCSVGSLTVAQRSATESLRCARDDLKGDSARPEKPTRHCKQRAVERKHADEERERAEERLRQAQAELAHISRVTAMGELTASLAHRSESTEICRARANPVTDANSLVLRWLTRDHPICRRREKLASENRQRRNTWRRKLSAGVPPAL